MPLSNPSLCAWYTMKPNKLKCQSLEQRKVYCKDQASVTQKTGFTPWWVFVEPKDTTRAKNGRVIYYLENSGGLSQNSVSPRVKFGKS